MGIAAWLVLVGAAGVLYLAGGYTLGLALVARWRWRTDPRPLEAYTMYPPTHLTVFLPVANEVDVIEDRLANLFDTTFPSARLDVVVGSDGSTDGTLDAVAAFADRHPSLEVSWQRFPEGTGKHALQNWIAEHARGDVLVFTDAETRFTPETLPALADALSDPHVGVAGGRVRFASRTGGSAFAAIYRAYRSLEDATRTLETRLGLGCKTDGSCTAARRSLWCPLAPFEAEDQALALVAKRAGYATVHVPEAVAWDAANDTGRQEFGQRRRMTRKALRTFVHRWSWGAARSAPGFTVAYVSHKILRFFLPVFAILLGAGLLLAAEAWAGPLLVGVTALLAGSAWAAGRREPALRRFGLPYAVAVANAAYLAGIADALVGRVPSSYVPTRRL